MSSSPFKHSPRPKAGSAHYVSLVAPDGCRMLQSVGRSDDQKSLVANLHRADKERTPAVAYAYLESYTARPREFNVTALPQILQAIDDAEMQNYRRHMQAADVTAFINVIRYRMTLLLESGSVGDSLRTDILHVLSVCDVPGYLDTNLVTNAKGQPLPSPKLHRPLFTCTIDSARVIVEDGERFRSNRSKFLRHCRDQGWVSDDITSHLCSFAMTMYRLFCVQGVQPQEFVCFTAAIMSGSCPDETIVWASLVVDTIVELRLTHRLYQLYQARRLCGQAKEGPEAVPWSSVQSPTHGMQGSRCAEDILTSVLVRAIRKRAATI